MAEKDAESISPRTNRQILPPVIVVCYNRPVLTENLVSVLRQVHPPHILIAADGPKPDNHEDQTSVANTRAAFEQIDWPCRIDRLFSDINLGCNKRVISGLDWAFNLVDEAIILEDDIDATPQFFLWAQRMLELYRNRDDIAMISGHNPLISWPEFTPGSSAIPSRRGGIWGWATWARAWHSVRSWPIDGHVNQVESDVLNCKFETSLSSMYQIYLSEARRRPLSWDVDFTLRMAMSGRRALVSPVNVIHHLGVGPDATHDKDSDDTLFFLPRRESYIPNALTELAENSVDQEFDRARVMLELLVRTKNSRLARLLARRVDLPIQNELRVHLLPFIFHDETLEVFEHLEREGLDYKRARYWSEAVGGGEN